MMMCRLAAFGRYRGVDLVLIGQCRLHFADRIGRSTCFGVSSQRK